MENIDVFCEKGVFEIEDSRTIMLACQKEGNVTISPAEIISFINKLEKLSEFAEV